MHKFDQKWSLKAGLSLDSSSRYSNYLPFLRGGYKVDDDLGITLRYRHYYKRISYNKGLKSRRRKPDTT